MNRDPTKVAHLLPSPLLPVNCDQNVSIGITRTLNPPPRLILRHTNVIILVHILEPRLHKPDMDHNRHDLLSAGA